GKRIITASSDNTARVWNGDDYTPNTLLVHDARIVEANFAPDGQHIVTASGDGTARVWNAGDGSLLAILQGHTELVASAAYSPDGQRILTASFDRRARLWRVLTLD